MLAGGEIQFRLPNQFQEQSFLDCDQFTPFVFETFTVENLCKLLSQTLCEHSIVFVGEQVQLSKITLGISALLYPFQWCFSLIPILPRAMIDYLEAPCPLLVGISPKQYKEVQLTQDERKSKIWVFLNENRIEWQRDPVPQFSFKEFR